MAAWDEAACTPCDRSKGENTTSFLCLLAKNAYCGFNYEETWENRQLRDILQNDLPVISKNIKVKKAKERRLLYSWSGMIPHAARQLSARATTAEPEIMRSMSSRPTGSGDESLPNGDEVCLG